MKCFSSVFDVSMVSPILAKKVRRRRKERRNVSTFLVRLEEAVMRVPSLTKNKQRMGEKGSLS